MDQSRSAHGDGGGRRAAIAASSPAGVTAVLVASVAVAMSGCSLPPDASNPLAGKHIGIIATTQGSPAIAPAVDANARGGAAPAVVTRPASAAPGPTARVAALVKAGIRQAGQQDWPAAATAFRNALAVDPRSVYALYDLGVVSQADGNTAGAVAYYGKALAIDAAYTPAMYNKAILLEKTEPAQALGLYRKIVSISRQDSAAYLRMAFVYARQGDLADARAADARAVAIDPALGKYPLPARH
jgi:tetratricopeptide (TPR) repeat protein